jgi:hypothetical protein
MSKISNRRIAIVVVAYLAWPIPVFLTIPRLFRAGGLCESLQCKITAVFLFQVTFFALIGL